jgi:4-carboxymuconolactone decarboxylase
VVLVGPDQLVHIETLDRGRPRLADLVRRFRRCDLVLVEGFSADAHPKIRVRGAGTTARTVRPPVLLDLERPADGWQERDLADALDTVLGVVQATPDRSDQEPTMEQYLPDIYTAFRDRFPEVAEANDRLGQATRTAGPLDERTQRLIRLGVAIGSLAEGAVKSSVRKALDQDLTPAELRHVAMLAVTTAGFPTAIAGLDWIEEVLASRD